MTHHNSTDKSQGRGDFVANLTTKYSKNAQQS